MFYGWKKKYNLSELGFSSRVGIFLLVPSDTELLYDKEEPLHANCTDMLMCSFSLLYMRAWAENLN